MAEARNETVLRPTLDPWPVTKYIELADQYDHEAGQMRTEARRMLDEANRLSLASLELRKAVEKEESSRPRAKRKDYARIDSTHIRDFAQSYGDWFQMSQLQKVVPGSRQQLGKHLKELIAKGTLEADGHKRRRKYRFVKPEGISGPFVAPRGEPSITQIRAKTIGNPVPHTNTKGPSGKQGANKKRASRGVRIRKRKSRGHS